MWGVSFQVLWFLTIALASQRRAEWAALINVVWVVALVYAQPKLQRPYLMWWGISGLIIGALGDGLIIGSGLYIPHQTGLGLPTPLWLLAMWISFAVFIPLSMGQVLKRPIIAVLFGLWGGPVSYFAGVQWDAMSFGDSATTALIATGLFWGIVMYIAAMVWRYYPLTLSHQT